MAQIESLGAEGKKSPGPKTAGTSKAYSRASLFKYYIHDSTESCRLQLVGELSEAEIPELDGCWATAKTILGQRPVVLDLRKVKTLDNAGRRWIISMANDGARLIPETFLDDDVACTADDSAAAGTGLISRLLCCIRGSRPITASSTQAR